MTFVVLILCNQVYHSTLLAAEAYSSPSIIMSHRYGDERIIIDDYREAYYWLKKNTEPDAKIMSWWDYGYQITGMANRTVLVDNNTWNNTHIATVGKAFASTEEEGAQIARHMGADYVLVIFGGLTNFSGDDISKFLWIIRIAAGVYPQVKEDSFYRNKKYSIGQDGSETLLNCLMYKLIYYRFDEMHTKRDEEPGYDSVRKQVVGNKNIKLQHFEEAYTTDRWLVRIYRLKPLPEMDPKMESRHGSATKALPISKKMAMPSF